MDLTTWSPADADTVGKAPPEELLITFDRGRSVRLLIIPAMFDEGHKLRRFTITVMRALDEAGFDSALPDWPGCHESTAPLAKQTLAGWQAYAERAAKIFDATHTLSLRAGALIAPNSLPGWRYAPLEGAKLLSGMLRAQMITFQEAGHTPDRQSFLARGREEGFTLGGWTLGPEMVRELETALPDTLSEPITINQTQLGGPGLWLRAEPDEDADQASALAKIIADALGTEESLGT